MYITIFTYVCAKFHDSIPLLGKILYCLFQRSRLLSTRDIDVMIVTLIFLIDNFNHMHETVYSYYTCSENKNNYSTLTLHTIAVRDGIKIIHEYYYST
jgi:hypothetical protein